MDRLPATERAREPGVVARVAVLVGQGRPVVGARGVRLDEEEVPARFRVAVDPERESGPGRRHRDRAGQPLERQVGLARVDELAAGSRRRPRHVEDRVDRIPVSDPRRAVGVDVELAHVHRREVGRHRVPGVPGPRRPAAARALALEDAVGHDLETRRHRDLERERRLVGGMVVGGEPARGAVRLTRDDRAVVGGDEPGLTAEYLEGGLGHAVVAHLDDELTALWQAAPRGDHELLAGAAPGRGAAVDLHGADLQADEVEVEGGQVLGGPCRDCGDAAEDVGGRVVAQVEVVVPDVVAPVPVQGVVGIADTRRAGRVGRAAAAAAPGSSAATSRNETISAIRRRITSPPSRRPGSRRFADDSTRPPLVNLAGAASRVIFATPGRQLDARSSSASTRRMAGPGPGRAALSNRARRR